MKRIKLENRIISLIYASLCQANGEYRRNPKNPAGYNVASISAKKIIKFIQNNYRRRKRE